MSPPPKAFDKATPKAPAPRGFLDLVLAVLLVYAVYAETSCGTLPVFAYRAWQGQPTPDLLASFRGRETAVRVSSQNLENMWAGADAPAPVSAAAEKYALDENLLMAFVAATQAQCVSESTECWVHAPAFLGQSLDSFSMPEQVTIDALGRGLYTEKEHFEKTGASAADATSLGLESLFVGRASLERALSQARVSGVQAPEWVENHAVFLSPSIRRGALLDAIQVLAHHRLRTLAWPADRSWRISSPYGDRIHPVLGTRRFHNGTDIAAPIGTPLYAAHVGVVQRTGEDSVSGRFVDLNVGFDIKATYCHLNEILTAQGLSVGRKEQIATVGDSGRVTGAHLHYILRVDGKTVDPQSYGEAPARTKQTP